MVVENAKQPYRATHQQNPGHDLPKTEPKKYASGMLGSEPISRMGTLQTMVHWFATGSNPIHAAVNSSRNIDVPRFGDRMAAVTEYAQDPRAFVAKYREIFERGAGVLDSAGRNRFDKALAGMESFGLQQLQKIQFEEAQAEKQRLEAKVLGDFESLDPNDAEKVWHFHSRFLCKLECGHERLKEFVVATDGDTISCNVCGKPPDKLKVLLKAGFQIVQPPKPTMIQKVKKRIRKKKE